MASPKGLIFLEARNAILHEQLQGRILGEVREPCEISFADFDEVSYRISVGEGSPNIVKVNMAIRNARELLSGGGQDVLDRLFPGMSARPDDGFNVAVEFNLDTITDKPRFLQNISELRRNVFGGPLDRAFTALTQRRSESVPAASIPKFEYRKGETIFICPSNSKVVVIFLVDFADVTDKAIAKVFLQEFVEAQRTVRTAPPVSYSKEPPGELAGVSVAYSGDSAGFLSFALEERHVQGPRQEAAITLLTGFRNYLHYHIKCSKTYLHMRMRKRVAGWMQVLNRAMPDVESEKKTAGGKTFNRSAAPPPPPEPAGGSKASPFGPRVGAK